MGNDAAKRTGVLHQAVTASRVTRCSHQGIARGLGAGSAPREPLAGSGFVIWGLDRCPRMGPQIGESHNVVRRQGQNTTTLR